MRLLKRKHQPGFTILESTIALGLLTIGVLASLILLTSSFNYSRQSENEIIVVNLAREGIEIFRSMRNSQNDSDPTDVDLFDGSYDGSRYFLDITDPNNASIINTANKTTAANAGQCPACALYLKNGQYLHDPSGALTPFRRLISVLPGTGNDEKIIISEISWTDKSASHSYKLEAYLTNWQ